MALLKLANFNKGGVGGGTLRREIKIEDILPEINYKGKKVSYRAKLLQTNNLKSKNIEKV